MKVAITEKQLKSITSKISPKMDVEEQEKTDSGKPKSGANAVQFGGEGYPEVTTWDEIVGSKISRGPANQLANTTWADTPGEQPERGPANQLYERYVFENHITIDGRFIIFHDDVFDLKENKHLGDIFDLDNAMLIFNSVKEKSKIIAKSRKILREKKIQKDTNFLNEVKEYALSNPLLLEQAQTINPEALNTQPNSITETLINGFLSVARYIKKFLWSIGGMAIDAFLSASGIGKFGQWIPWAIVTVLDVYELSSGNYGSDTELEDSSTLWKFLTIGFDIMGLLTSGPIAKYVSKLFEPVKTLVKQSEIGQWLAKTPSAQKYLTKIYDFIKFVPDKLQEAGKLLAETKMGKFIAPLLGTVSNFLETVRTTLSNTLSLAYKVVSLPGNVAEFLGKTIERTALGKAFRNLTGSEMDILKNMLTKGNLSNTEKEVLVSLDTQGFSQLSAQEQNVLTNLKNAKNRLNPDEINVLNKIENNATNIGSGMKVGTNVGAVGELVKPNENNLANTFAQHINTRLNVAF